MNKQSIQNDSEEWLTKLAALHDRMQEHKHLPVFSEAAAQVCLHLSSLPSFSTHQSGSTPCQKSLVCFALDVSVGPITVSHWLLGALRAGMKQQKEAKHV